MLSGEDQTLLVRGNSLLVLDLGFDIVDCVGGLDLKGDGLARKGLDEAIDRLSVTSRYIVTVVRYRVAVSHLHCKGRQVSLNFRRYTFRGGRHDLLIAVVDVVVDEISRYRKFGVKCLFGRRRQAKP